METVWKDIPGYEGHYQVSNTGEVRSIKRHPTILKADHQRNGYKRVYLWRDNGKKNCLVHRLVAEAFIPNPSQLTDVNHLDENKDNNAVTNLEWCTHLYNMNYGSAKEKIRAASLGRTYSEEVKKKISLNSSMSRWINNGEAERFVCKDAVDDYVANGWIVGRLKKRRLENVRTSESLAC